MPNLNEWGVIPIPTGSTTQYATMHDAWVGDFNATSSELVDGVQYTYAIDDGTPTWVEIRIRNGGDPWDGIFVIAGWAPITFTANNEIYHFHLYSDDACAIDPASDGFRNRWGTLSISTLPVEFKQFTATCLNGAAHLNWSTFTELNNDYFTIERSSDGYVFEVIAQVTGSGTTNQLSAYQWVDDRPLPGLSYYRLSQTDYDGTHTILKTISYVHECAETDYSISIYPNPLTEQSMVKLTLENESDVQLQVVDNSGRLVAHISPMTVKSAGVYEWSFANFQLSNGVYFLQLTVNDKIETIKFVK